MQTNTWAKDITNSKQLLNAILIPSSWLSRYFDLGGGYHKLTNSFQINGVQHLTAPPYTPQHNGPCKWWHQHIVETGLTLLHQALMLLSKWPFAFHTTTYLIKPMPTWILHSQSPFEALFHTPPNYTKLKTFGRLSLPLAMPICSTQVRPKI